MNTSATLQHTIQIRPSRFAGLLVAVATLTAVATWAIGNVNESSPSRATASVASAPSSSTKAYVDGVTALTAEQRASIYGNVSSAQHYVDGVTALTAEQRASIYGNVSSAQHYVDDVTALTPAELAATYGNVPVGSTP